MTPMAEISTTLLHINQNVPSILGMRVSSIGYCLCPGNPPQPRVTRFESRSFSGSPHVKIRSAISKPTNLHKPFVISPWHLVGNEIFESLRAEGFEGNEVNNVPWNLPKAPKPLVSILVIHSLDPGASASRNSSTKHFGYKYSTNTSYRRVRNRMG